MSDEFPTLSEVGESNIRQRRQRLARQGENWDTHCTGDPGYGGEIVKQTDKPKICPLMSRPVLSNGNVIALKKIECLQDECAFWVHGYLAPASMEQAPCGEPVEIRHEIKGKCGFRRP